MKKLVGLFFFATVFVFSLSAQRVVTGSITDDTGEALIGANVLAKGTSVGTITDIDGAFSFEVPADVNELVVTYAGFGTQEITLGADSFYNISLSEGTFLDEVVVLGYSQTKRKDLTGSVSSVDLADYNDVALPAAQIALQGSTSGVTVTKNSGTPGGGIDVRVRGTTSINASSQPLYIVDGIPIIDDNTSFTQEGVGNAQLSVLSDLNPNEIESIEVLKDAASSAIYGSRGCKWCRCYYNKERCERRNKNQFQCFCRYIRACKKN